jgi:hypothetical protein
MSGMILYSRFVEAISLFERALFDHAGEIVAQVDSILHAQLKDSLGKRKRQMTFCKDLQYIYRHVNGEKPVFIVRRFGHRTKTVWILKATFR